MANLREKWIPAANKFNNMTSWWRQITSLCQSSYEVVNDEYIIVYNFGGRRTRGFKVIEGDLRAPPSQVARGKKKARAE